MHRNLSCFLLSFFALCLALPGAGQSHTAPGQIGSWPEGLSSLNSGWRFHVGDDPAYSRPDFDDSSWRVVSLSNSDKSTAGLGYRWYRLHVRTPEHSGPLVVWVGANGGAFELYVNGKPAGDSRILPLFRAGQAPRLEMIPLPQRTNDFEFAVRTRNNRIVFSYDKNAPNLYSFLIGTGPTVRFLAKNSAVGGVYLAHGSSLAIDVALLLAALAPLGLFLFQRSRVEYLWLGAFLGLIGAEDLLYQLCYWGWPAVLNAVFSDPAGYIVGVFQIEFTFAFAMQRVGRAWRVYEVLMVITALVAIPANLMGGFSAAYFMYEGVAQLIPALGMPILLLLWFRRGNREAGWLILPSLLPGLTSAAFNLGWIARVYLHDERLGFMMDPFHIGPLSFYPQELSYFLFLLAIGVVMFFRFTRVTAAETRAAAELDAAREMQRKLVPAVLPKVEGCTLSASYLPAAEVGGDFYQVLPQPDGSTLIVVGDVSGKGLKAAMTGTFALGALRTLASSNPAPAALLAGLNEEIVHAEQEGFITMLCARIAPDGDVTLANAGHLHPYRNGVELELDSGVPLGVTAGASYAETHIRLAPSDTLTFMSDGVVEAKKETGELFGFERTQAISGESARNIAEAARSFGQQDDITVLSLSMSPAGALAG